MSEITYLYDELEAAAKEIERLTKELDPALSDAACYRDEGYKLTAEIERYENAMREIQAATSDKVVLAIIDKALCGEHQ